MRQQKFFMFDTIFSGRVVERGKMHARQCGGTACIVEHFRAQKSAGRKKSNKIFRCIRSVKCGLIFKRARGGRQVHTPRILIGKTGAEMFHDASCSTTFSRSDFSTLDDATPKYCVKHEEFLLTHLSVVDTHSRIESDDFPHLP